MCSELFGFIDGKYTRINFKSIIIFLNKLPKEKFTINSGKVNIKAIYKDSIIFFPFEDEKVLSEFFHELKDEE